MTKDAVAKTWNPDDLYLGSDGLCYSDPSQAPGDDLVLSSWWNSLKPLEVLWPLPDSDAASQPYHYHRMIPTESEYSFPIFVEGGGWPYNVDILDGHPGATIDYGNIRATGRPPFFFKVIVADPQIGTYNWHFRIRDQNGDAVEIEWSSEVIDVDDTDHFLHFDSATGNNANPGTRASPKADINGWYLSDEDDATHAQKHCRYQGEFNLGGVGGVPYEDGYKLVLNGNKPKTHVGYGTGATWHGNGVFPSLETSDNAAGRGFAFVNLTYDDPQVTDGPNTWNQMFKGNNNYATGGLMYRIDFIGSGLPSSGSTNPSCIGIVDVGFIARNFAVVDCTFTNVVGQAIIQAWNATKIGVEGLTFQDCNSGFHLKGGLLTDWCMRGIDASDGNTFDFSYCKLEWISNPVSRSGIEVCWSNINSPTFVGFWQQGNVDDVFDDNEVFRCNFNVAYNENSAQNGSLTIGECVIQHDGTEPNGLLNTGYSVTLTDNDIATSGLLDSDGWLVGGPTNDSGCEYEI